MIGLIMASWTRRDGGLWVPSDVLPVQAQILRPRDGFAVWVQAVATVTALAIAAWSAWMTFRLTESQVQANQSQVTANQITQDRLMARFASKVSYWIKERTCDDHDTCTLVIQIDNRSSARLLGAAFTQADRPTPSSRLRMFGINWRFPDVPACQRVVVTVYTRPDEQPGAMYFVDPAGFWAIDFVGTVWNVGNARVGTVWSLNQKEPTLETIQQFQDCAEN
ncbi:hypothetical protein [Catellatospora sichuanensis]|uniref:hypothetical protein n=1 Tax=Catellatospora sichuanensis TaxID=1969805 RepID=UPI0011842176|nr:hypothetical protein [Catellatospora sichuanensis]